MAQEKSVGYKDSRSSPKKYFEWRVERSKETVNKINKIINLNKTKVLEVGCGYGALSQLLLKKGAYVTATEVDSNSLLFAKKFLKNKKNIKLIKVNSEKLKFKKNSFDLVILFDVIEHVKNPKIMMNEAIRVLKPGGILYVEFTPYYSIIGHHLYDYAKWPIHILPRKYIKKIIFSKKTNNFFNTNEVWKQFLALNKLRIFEFQLFTKNLKVLNEKYIIKYPDVLELNLPLPRFFGPLNDYLCFSFEGIYKK